MPLRICTSCYPRTGEVGIIARVELTGTILPGRRIPVDDPPTTLRATHARLVELHLKSADVDLLNAEAPLPRGATRPVPPDPRPLARPPRTWRELITRPIMAPALRPQSDRALRLERRSAVRVNAAAFLI